MDDHEAYDAGTYTDDRSARGVLVYVDRKSGKVIDQAYLNDGTDDYAARQMEAALDTEDESTVEPEPIPVATVPKVYERNVYGFYISDNYQHGLGEVFEVDDKTWQEAQAGFSRFEITPDLDRRERHYWLNVLYLCEEYARAEALNNGEWSYLGCQAIAEVDDCVEEEDVHHFTESSGVWGIESDCEDYRKEVEAEQVEELRELLAGLGVECAPDVEIIREDY